MLIVEMKAISAKVEHVCFEYPIKILNIQNGDMLYGKFALEKNFSLMLGDTIP